MEEQLKMFEKEIKKREVELINETDQKGHYEKTVRKFNAVYCSRYNENVEVSGCLSCEYFVRELDFTIICSY